MEISRIFTVYFQLFTKFLADIIALPQYDHPSMGEKSPVYGKRSHAQLRQDLFACCHERSCKIYFLCRKEKPGTPYGTIEVRGNALAQAKGFANNRLEQSVQDFIRKWCAAKQVRQNISISRQEIFRML